MKQYNIVFSEFELRIMANLIEAEKTKENASQGVIESIGGEVLQSMVDKVTDLIGIDITISLHREKL